MQEEVSEKLCPEVKAKEQWDSLQDEQVEKLCPEVERTEEKPKEQLDSLQEEGAEKWCLEIDKTEEKPGKQLESLQEKDVEKLCPEVDKRAVIIKEVRNVKRQNLITHCLVSTMILLTAAWQISEVSLLLKVKNGLRNPFDFFGGIIKGLILKGARHELDRERSSAKQKPAIKPPLFKLPDLPLLDLHIFYSTDEE